MNKTKESFYYIDEIKEEYDNPETSLEVAKNPDRTKYSYCVLGALILDNKYFLETATDADDDLSQFIRSAEAMFMIQDIFQMKQKLDQHCYISLIFLITKMLLITQNILLIR